MNIAEVIIAMPTGEASSRIRSLLNSHGFYVIDVCSAGSEIIRKVRMLKPSIVIVNFELPDTTGFEVAKIIMEDKLCTVVLLTNEMQKQYIESVIDNIDLICLNKPLNKTLLIHTLEMVMRSRRKISELEQELNDLRKNVESRKCIDKAKSLLMKEVGLSEPDAYRKIQKQSMDSGVPMKDVAKTIIVQYSVAE